VIRDVGAAIRAVLGRGEAVLVFLAGPNGAGKSTFFRDHLQALGLTFVNADEIARRLRETALPSATDDFERLAFEKAEQVRKSLLERRLSFCTETVFSDPQGSKLGFLKRARDSGYAVLLVFIGLSEPELSFARVVHRVEQGGHDVPDEKLRGRFPRTLSNLRLAIPIVDEAFLFDNSSSREPFRPIAVYSGGHVVWRAESLPAWAAGLPSL
jgi:predicted ABC-type ATPase